MTELKEKKNEIGVPPSLVMVRQLPVVLLVILLPVECCALP